MFAKKSLCRAREQSTINPRADAYSHLSGQDPCRNSSGDSGRDFDRCDHDGCCFGHCLGSRCARCQPFCRTQCADIAIQSCCAPCASSAGRDAGGRSQRSGHRHSGSRTAAARGCIAVCGQRRAFNNVTLAKSKRAISANGAANRSSIATFGTRSGQAINWAGSPTVLAVEPAGPGDGPHAAERSARPRVLVDDRSTTMGLDRGSCFDRRRDWRAGGVAAECPPTPEKRG